MTSTEKKYYEDLIPASVKKAVETTFSMDSDKLPSKKVLDEHIKSVDDFFSKPDHFKKAKRSLLNKIPDADESKKFMLPFYIREMYLEKCFVVYTHEMMTAIKKFTLKHKMKTVHELSCGTGWMSHWMKKYKIPLKHAVDNKSWGKYKTTDSFLPIVKKADSAKFVESNQDADMFVLSWPYMDPVARMIWDRMKKGQYLLYIGERREGCTADDSFFDAVYRHEVENDKEFNNIKKSFVQFWGLHDEPILYKK